MAGSESIIRTIQFNSFALNYSKINAIFNLKDNPQFKIAKENNLTLVTMDRDFEKVTDSILVNFL